MTHLAIEIIKARRAGKFDDEIRELAKEERHRSCLTGEPFELRSLPNGGWQIQSPSFDPKNPKLEIEILGNLETIEED